MKTLRGNILDLAEAGYFHVVVQGCNCFCTMGSGLAREIRERYPEAYAADLETQSGDRTKLGTYTKAWVGEKKFLIINAYTQYGFNRAGARQDVFEYTAFDTILDTMFEDVLVGNLPATVGFPRIGQGLAGGDSARIQAQLEAFAQRLEAIGAEAVLVEFEPGRV
jgi:O-acetyl-ADP-ribose deacetylase (regulator of RNase III)